LKKKSTFKFRLKPVKEIYHFVQDLSRALHPEYSQIILITKGNQNFNPVRFVDGISIAFLILNLYIFVYKKVAT